MPFQKVSTSSGGGGRSNSHQQEEYYDAASCVVERNQQPFGVCVVGESSVDLLEFDTQRWWPLPQPPLNIAASAVASTQSCIYQVGGIHLPNDDEDGETSTPSTSSHYLSSAAHVLEFRSTTWRALPNMHHPRCYAAVHFVDDHRLLVVGGRGRNMQPSRSVEIFDVSRQEWTVQTPLLKRRMAPAIVPLRYNQRKSIAVIGGYNAQGEWDTTVEYYDADLDKWSIDGPIPPMSTPVAFPRAVATRSTSDKSSPTERVLLVGTSILRPTSSQDTHTTIWAYTLASPIKKWKKLITSNPKHRSKLLIPNEGCTIALHSDHNTLYTIGGRPQHSPNNTSSYTHASSQVLSWKIPIHERALAKDLQLDIGGMLLSPGASYSNNISNLGNSSTTSLLMSPSARPPSSPRRASHQRITPGRSRSNYSSTGTTRARLPGIPLSPATSPAKSQSPSLHSRNSVGNRIIQGGGPTAIPFSTIQVEDKAAAASTRANRRGSLEGEESVISSMSVSRRDASPPPHHSPKNSNHLKDKYWTSKRRSSISTDDDDDDEDNYDDNKNNTKAPAVDTIAVTDMDYVDYFSTPGKYTGQVQSQSGPYPLAPHGSGVFVSNLTKDRFEGDWKNGQRHGVGKWIFETTGDIFEGTFVQDQKHGRGNYQWRDGRCFEGLYQYDLAHDPNGTLTWKNGTLYVGSFERGQRTGKGKIHFPSTNVKYQGEFKNGKYDGYGTCTFEDSKVYRGYWRKGKAHGRGILLEPNGTVIHDGDWEDDSAMLEE